MNSQTIALNSKKDSFRLLKKTVGYITTPFFIVTFFLTLVFFQPPLIFARNFLSDNAFKLTLEMMNRFILWELRLAGTHFDFQLRNDIPTDRPLIIVSNHQSMYDIPMMIISFKKHNPKFIAKIELAKWIPSISYALRVMGSALINRGEQKEALKIIENFGKEINSKKIAACIFPEGTRAKDGTLKKFKHAGLVILLKAMPDALIVPVTIDGAWELLRYKFLPVPFGTKVTFKVLDPIEPAGRDPKELALQIEKIIKDNLLN